MRHLRQLPARCGRLPRSQRYAHAFPPSASSLTLRPSPSSIKHEDWTGDRSPAIAVPSSPSAAPRARFAGRWVAMLCRL